MLPKFARSSLLSAAVLFSAPSVFAAPRHDICADIPPYFGIGVSSFNDYGPAFITETKANEGIDWNYVYLYVGPSGNRTDQDFITYVLLPKLQQAKDIGAMPVVTFYNLLRLGQNFASPPRTGTEGEIVQSVLKDPALMKEYFADFVYILEATATLGGPFQMHVEPDSWGFMMWAMGVEGNGDASSVEVAVASSGFAGLEGFPNNAGGFGQALLHLRDTYAPEARMGWHASNFRFNSRPEVVTSFYSSMGDWDLLVGEDGNFYGANWWDDLDPSVLAAHMNWNKVVSEGAKLPILSWQSQIGSTDYHFLEATGDFSRVEEYARNGVIGFEFALISDGGDINDARAQEAGAKEIPPSEHPADGTAGAMRRRVAEYYKAKVAWPEGSICAGGSNTITDGTYTPAPGGAGAPGNPGTGGDGDGDGDSDGSGNATGGGTSSTPGDSGEDDSSSDGGCALGPAKGRGPVGNWAFWALLPGLAFVGRRRALLKSMNV